jgi:hypothetical protein
MLDARYRALGNTATALIAGGPTMKENARHAAAANLIFAIVSAMSLAESRLLGRSV